MTTVRIYAETRDNLFNIVSWHFPSFTVYQGTGYWQGSKEPCTVIEIISDESKEIMADKVRKVAREIKTENEQEAVLVTWGQVESELY